MFELKGIVTMLHSDLILFYYNSQHLLKELLIVLFFVITKIKSAKMYRTTWSFYWNRAMMEKIRMKIKK